MIRGGDGGGDGGFGLVVYNGFGVGMVDGVEP